MTDEFGISGNILHYALIIFFVGGALITFIYLWYEGRLDMDEGPKYQMMDDEEKEKKDGRSSR